MKSVITGAWGLKILIISENKNLEETDRIKLQRNNGVNGWKWRVRSGLEGNLD